MNIKKWFFLCFFPLLVLIILVVYLVSQSPYAYDNNSTVVNANNALPDTIKPVDINTASIKELTALPGIGDVTAGRIIEYRKQIGRFNDINELLNVKGIGITSFNKLMYYVYCT